MNTGIIQHPLFSGLNFTFEDAFWKFFNFCKKLNYGGRNEKV